LLQLPQLQHIKHLPLLQKLGKCIADSIYFRKDTESLKLLLNKFQKDTWRQLSPLILKVDLLIILQVLKYTDFADKENSLFKVFLKDFHQKDIAQLLNQS